MSNSKRAATFHPSSEPTRPSRAPAGTFHGQDTPDTAEIPDDSPAHGETCETCRLRAALDAATARAEAAERDRRANDQAWHITARNMADERDRARSTAALLEAEVARLEHDRAHPYGELAESGEPR